MANTFSAQQWSLNSLATVVLDNHVAHDYLLTEQGGVCTIANTSCCRWINASGEVEIQLYKIKEQAHWLQQISLDNPLSFDLFSWLPSSMGSWFRIILQTEFIMLF